MKRLIIIILLNAFGVVNLLYSEEISSNLKYNPEIDIPIAIGSAAFMGGAYYFLQSDNRHDNLIKISNNSWINRNIDNSMIYKSNKTLSRASDVLLIGLFAAPIIYSARDGFGDDFFETNLFYFQATTTNVGLNFMTKDLIYRQRPYSLNMEKSEKQVAGDNLNSFYSGHTSLAFSSAIFMGMIYENTTSNNTNSTYVWAGSLLIASTVAALRVYSGNHYLSDVIFGAVVGSLISYLTVELHKQNNISENTPIRSIGISFNI